MKVTVIYDNEVHRNNTSLEKDWGFSCLIETGKEAILFDTGAEGKILLSNMRLLGIEPRSIDKVVLSHEHRDHTGGLRMLAPLLKDGTEVYRFKEKLPDERLHLRVVESAQSITDKVYTTGRLRGFVDEQSLIIMGKKGLYVLTGCSHPGVEKILNAAGKYGRVVGLIGGFHGFSDFEILKNMALIVPCHCTRFKKQIIEMYPDASLVCGVGRVFEI